jgi:hypothetical protein
MGELVLGCSGCFDWCIRKRAKNIEQFCPIAVSLQYQYQEIFISMPFDIAVVTTLRVTL